MSSKAILLRSLIGLLVTCATGTRVQAEPNGRAVLIGIDYRSLQGGGDSRFRQALLGTANDVEAFRVLLVDRFDFQHITILRNTEATRKRILETLRKELVEKSQEDDTIFVYFSGHGSRIRNSLSPEDDGKDETIVAADGRDIRDKELAVVFNRILDRGARLTAVFDSCHSASLSRRSAVRGVAESLKDVAAPFSPPRPEQRGGLFLYAAQHDQKAIEVLDEHGNWHGALTAALLAALRSNRSGASASRIFQATRARMRLLAPLQEPALAALPERLKQPLFGALREGASRGVTAAVLRRSGTKVTLDGGLAAGLTAGCELSLEFDPAGRVRIRIEKSSLAHSSARLVSGSPEAVDPGSVFRLDRWVPPSGESLRFRLPPGVARLDAVLRLADEVRQGASPKTQWLDDPVAATPTHFLSWFGSEWRLRQSGSQEMERVPAAPPERLLSRLQAAIAPRVLLQLPPKAPLRKKLAGMVRLEDGRERGADYELAGRVKRGSLEYAWVRLDRTDPPQPLPTRGPWIGSDARSTTELAARLAAQGACLDRVFRWLRLETPPDSSFPFSLALQNTFSGEQIQEGVVRDQERYELVLIPDGSPAHCDRYVYVFSISPVGETGLLFPLPGQGNVENRVGCDRSSGAIRLRRPPFRIAPPFGWDILILLTTNEPLVNPDALVTDCGGRPPAERPDRSLLDPLSSLLWDPRGFGGPQRKQRRVLPDFWSIQRVVFESRPREGS